jgi:hypothetical protein
MKAQLLVLTILVMLLPVGVVGCGKSQPSYKDRVGKVDTSNAYPDLPSPAAQQATKKK